MSTRESGDEDVLTETDSAGYGLAQYKLPLSLVSAVVATGMLGYVIDIAAGPLTESTTLAHQISGLFGALALVLAICSVVLAVLWGGFLLTKR